MILIVEYNDGQYVYLSTSTGSAAGHIAQVLRILNVGEPGSCNSSHIRPVMDDISRLLFGGWLPGTSMCVPHQHHHNRDNNRYESQSDQTTKQAVSFALASIAL